MDKPDWNQRREVIEKLLTRKMREFEEDSKNIDVIDVNSIIKATEHYTPAEIEKAIDNALFRAYAEDKRPVTTEDVVQEAGLFAPLYNSRKDEIDKMRKWAIGESGKGGQARLANGVSWGDGERKKADTKVRRKLDIGEDTLDGVGL